MDVRVVQQVHRGVSKQQAVAGRLYKHPDWLVDCGSLGAKTDTVRSLSTGTSLSSDVDENFTSTLSDMPFCSVLITSTVYVPYGNPTVGSGHFSRL